MRTCLQLLVPNINTLHNFNDAVAVEQWNIERAMNGITTTLKAIIIPQ